MIGLSHTLSDHKSFLKRRNSEFQLAFHMGRHRANTSFSDSGGPMFDLTCICPSLSCVNNDTGGAFSPFFFFFWVCGFLYTYTSHKRKAHTHTRLTKGEVSPLQHFLLCEPEETKRAAAWQCVYQRPVTQHRRVSPVLEKQNVVITLLSWWVFFLLFGHPNGRRI